MHWRFPLHNRIRKLAASGADNSTLLAAQDGAGCETEQVQGTDGWNPKLRPGVKRGDSFRLPDNTSPNIPAGSRCSRSESSRGDRSTLSPGRPAILKNQPTPQRTCGTASPSCCWMSGKLRACGIDALLFVRRGFRLPAQADSQKQRQQDWTPPGHGKSLPAGWPFAPR